MTYEIRYSNGQPSVSTATYDDAIDVIIEEFGDDSVWSHDGDLSEGGDRTMCWESEEDSENDGGENAVASIYKID